MMVVEVDGEGVTVEVVGGGIKNINEKSHRPQNSTMSHLLNSAPKAVRNF